METQKTSAKKIIINYGVLLGILSVLLGAIIYITNSYKDPNWIFSVLGVGILTAVIILAIKAFKKANGGFLTLGEALKVGIGTALIGGLIGAIWTLVLTNVLEPDYMQQVMEVQKEKMLDQGLSEEQIEASAEMMEKFSNPLISVAFSLIGNLFFGFIISLIGGLIMQKKQDLY